MMQRKKVIFHIGATKTGSTYLQSFLSQNIDFLNSHGIDYPYAETQETIQSGSCVGNLLRLLYLVESIGKTDNSCVPYTLDRMWNSGCVKEILRVVKESKYDAILFSSEGLIGLQPERIREIEISLISDYDVVFICFLRDPFFQFYSAWKQRVKMGIMNEDFVEMLRRNLQSNKSKAQNMVSCFINYKNSVTNLRVLNYDTYSKNLSDVFLKEIGAVDETNKSDFFQVHSCIENRSFSNSESILQLKVNQHFQGSQFPFFLSTLFKSRKEHISIQENYYNLEADKLILDTYLKEIHEINKVIIGEPLRTSILNEIENSISIQEADLELLMKAFKKVQDENNKKLSFKNRIIRIIKFLRFKNVPRDFNPIAYIALNKDLEIANVEPYQHYSRYGYREGRPFKYY